MKQLREKKTEKILTKPQWAVEQLQETKFL